MEWEESEIFIKAHEKKVKLYDFVDTHGVILSSFIQIDNKFRVTEDAVMLFSEKKDAMAYCEDLAMRYIQEEIDFYTDIKKRLEKRKNGC